MKILPDHAVNRNGIWYVICPRCCHAYPVSQMRTTPNPLDPYDDHARVLICVECIRKREEMARTPEKVTKSRGRAHAFAVILAACVVGALCIFFAFRGGQP